MMPGMGWPGWFPVVSWPQVTMREVMPGNVVRVVARVGAGQVEMAREPRRVEHSVDDDGQDQQRGHTAPGAEVPVVVPAVAAVVTPEHCAPHTKTATMPDDRAMSVSPART